MALTEGRSKPKKVAAGAAIGVAIPAAVAVAKKLMSDHGTEERRPENETKQQPRSEPTRRARPKAPRRKARTAPAKRTTREQLYAQAARLKIGGRSSMSKAELERAVQRAKQKGKKS